MPESTYLSSLGENTITAEIAYKTKRRLIAKEVPVRRAGRRDSDLLLFGPSTQPELCLGRWWSERGDSSMVVGVVASCELRQKGRGANE